ncbi:Uncharacterised protein [Roseomonas gilardii subsp. rosea]|nr:Uncharacterised protein [Roseomonas gilardii subsp. rosea]
MRAATAGAVLSRGQGSAFPPDPLSARTLCALDPVSWLSPTPIAPVPRLSAEAPEMHPALAEGDRGRQRLPWGLTTKHPRRSKDDNR